MVTIPTLDEIAGSTVMVKMRELIKKFIGFAGEVDTALDDRYTKAEVNTIANNISADVDELSDDVADNTTAIEQINTDLGSNYYTKQEVNNINNLVNYYNITSLNETFEHINDRIISGEEELADDIAGKQDILTAGDNITIVNNVISASGGSGEWQIYNSTDWSVFLENNVTTEDLIIEFVGGGLTYFQIFVPKGTSKSRTICGSFLTQQVLYAPPEFIDVQLSQIFTNAISQNNIGYYYEEVTEYNGIITIKVDQGNTTFTRKTDFNISDKRVVRIYVRV